MPKTPTLKDVACVAGVSVSTASRALHLKPGTSPVSIATQSRVRKVALELGYRANRLARSLSRNHTETIGVVLPLDPESLAKAYNSLILAGVAQVASLHGFALALYNADPASRRNYARTMRDGRVDGGIVIESTIMTHEQVTQLEEETDFPIIVVGHRLEGTSVPFVAADDRGASAELTRFLLGLGHRRIVHIHFPFGHPATQRCLGFLDAMGAAGLSNEPSIVVEDRQGDDPSHVDHSDLVRSLFARRSPPTAVYAWNDTVAASVIQSAVRMGMRVPEDLSVVGFNDFTIARLTNPPLTTVREPLVEMGRRATELLIERIERARRGDPELQPVQHVLPTEIVLRESTAPPPCAQGEGNGLSATGDPARGDAPRLSEENRSVAYPQTNCYSLGASR